MIIEDDCFIGARSEVAEGVIVERGSVLSMGVFLGASTKIVDRATGEIFIGRVPAYSVVVPGTLPGKPCRTASPGPVARLRRDRQARRRAHPRQDLDQRVAARLSTRRPASTRSAQALIRRPSVTPADAGAQAVLAAALKASASPSPGCAYGADREPVRPHRRRRPAFLLRRPHRRGAGRRRHWSADPFAGEIRDGVLYGRGACDMKGAHRRLRRRRRATICRQAAARLDQPADHRRRGRRRRPTAPCACWTGWQRTTRSPISAWSASRPTRPASAT